MLFSDLLCYIVLSVTITYVSADLSTNYEVLENTNHKISKRLVKRDAAIIIDNFPVEPIYRSRSGPSVIYRRISTRPYKSPPQYGPPKLIYPPSKRRKPVKKYAKLPTSKYGPPSKRKRPLKIRYGPPKQIYKPVYRPPKKVPSAYYAPDMVDFGEPPTDFMEDVHSKPSFGEPPTETYSDHELTASKSYQPLKHFSDQPIYHDSPDLNFSQDYQGSQNYYNNFDSKYEYSKKRPVYVKPETYFENVTPDKDLEIDYEDQKYSRMVKKQNVYVSTFDPKKRKESVYKNKPTKMQTSEPDEEVIVGGQYAEPPARYVPKYSPISTTQNDEDEYLQTRYYMDPNAVSSASISPYVNYKNSNLAFSPQNLNDAFSIVEK